MNLPFLTLKVFDDALNIVELVQHVMSTALLKTSSAYHPKNLEIQENLPKFIT